MNTRSDSVKPFASGLGSIIVPMYEEDQQQLTIKNEPVPPPVPLAKTLATLV
jgi:hypothetical protein